MSVGPEVERKKLASTVERHETRIVALERTPDKHTMYVVVDGGGQVLTTGHKVDIRVHRRYDLLSWTLLADQSGSIQMDVWLDLFANFPPTDADSITNGFEPSLSGDDAAEAVIGPDDDDWSVTTLNIGDCLRFNIDSVATITRISLLLELLGR